jgi:hypothetical protein
MPKGYTKGDIEFHELHYYGPAFPAVNVKVYHYPDLWDVVDAFDCSEDAAEKALNCAFEATQEAFWDDVAQSYADQYLTERFGKVKAYSAGRSNGWLVVDKIGDREAVEDEWDAIDLTAWYSFQDAIKAQVKYMTSWDYVKDMLDSNGLTED